MKIVLGQYFLSINLIRIGVANVLNSNSPPQMFELVGPTAEEAWAGAHHFPGSLERGSLDAGNLRDQERCWQQGQIRFLWQGKLWILIRTNTLWISIRTNTLWISIKTNTSIRTNTISMAR